MAATTAGSNNDDHMRHQGQQSPLASRRRQQQKGEDAKRNTWFPLSLKDTFSQWWANVPAATAEHNVMSFIPYVKEVPTHTQTGTIPPSEMPVVDANPINPASDNAVDTISSNDPYGPRHWSSNLVILSGKNRALNEFSVERSGEQSNQNLVMLHGYGAGLGFFYKNFEGLSRVPGWKIYALDMLGMGRSSRPPFKLKSKDRQQCITEAENWFIDALEEWRIQRKIERFTLLAHSLGGYMGVAYALKYPGRLNKLVLASPVGVPEDPYAVEADLPETKRTSGNAMKRHESPGDDGTETSDSDKKRPEDNEKPRKPLPRWLSYLWDANISPFSLVRMTGPLGPRLVSGWTSRRFSHLSPEEARTLHTYAYTLFRQRGSGEYALAYILAPGAFARSPLIRRIAGVGRQYIQTDGTQTSSLQYESRKRENGIPIVFIYGENDWMDVAGGYAAADKIKEARSQALEKASSNERLGDKGSAKVIVVKDAGHHVYLDNSKDFNKLMREEMEAISEPSSSS